MSEAPKSLRLHIALFGRVNSGKSSFLNLMTGQHAAITSNIAGTTTDVVEKAQELTPLGPVLWLDTAGFGDETQLSTERLERTQRAFDRADVACLILKGDGIGLCEQKIMQQLDERKIPFIKIYNYADQYEITATDGIAVNSTDWTMRDKVLNEFKSALLKICPDDFVKQPPLVHDLAPKESGIVMIVPLDYEAPKGRLIMPQVMAIRDCLDNGQHITVVKEDEYAKVLENFKNPPALVICDSQVVDKMVKETPPNIKCTTFSILMARFKGDLQKMVQGAEMIEKLVDGDKVLIAESCTHHAVDDDIGRVKIPNWLLKKTGKKLQIDHVSGCDFGTDLASYKLVIQCGGCTMNRKEIYRVFTSVKRSVWL